MNLARPPVAVLRWHVCCRGDADIGVDPEESQELPVSGFGWVCECEGRDAVLEDVGEDEEAVFFRSHLAEDLERRSLDFFVSTKAFLANCRTAYLTFLPMMP